MPKSIEEIFKVLEGFEEGEEFISGLKEELSRKNREAKGLRDRLKTSELTLEELKNNYSKVLNHLEINEEDELETALEAIKNKGYKNGSELELKLEQMSREISKLQKYKETSETLLKEEREKRLSILKETALLNALNEGKAIKPKVLLPILNVFIKANEDGNLVFLADDEEVSVEEGVKKWLANNPEFVSSNLNAGSGSGSARGGNIDPLEQAKELAQERMKAQGQPAQGFNPWGK